MERKKNLKFFIGVEWGLDGIVFVDFYVCVLSYSCCCGLWYCVGFVELSCMFMYVCDLKFFFGGNIYVWFVVIVWNLK